MNKPIWLGSLIIMIVAVTSCGDSRSKQAATSPNPSPAVPPAVGKPLQAPIASGQRSANPSLSAEQSQKSASTLRLVQPTDPARRAQQAENVAVGRSDPFAPTASRVISSTPANSNITNSDIANSNIQPLQQPGLTAPFPSFAPLPQLPPVVLTAPLPVPSAPSIVQLPALPATAPTALPTTQTPVAVPAAPVAALPQAPVAPVSFARAIQVMGVVQTKGKMTAIVEVPGEGTPRAVSVGERLGNGTVLVKRIQADGSQEPIVVLEERGREIFRAVGSATTSINPAF